MQSAKCKSPITNHQSLITNRWLLLYFDSSDPDQRLVARIFFLHHSHETVRSAFRCRLRAQTLKQLA